MQLSLLLVAFPQAGLSRSFGGPGAGLSWDSRGHLVVLERHNDGPVAVTVRCIRRQSTALSRA